MKTIFSLLLFAILITGHASPQSDPYMAAGVPSPDKPWTVLEYLKAYNQIRKNNLALPVLSDPNGGKLIRQIANKNNLKSLLDKGDPLNERIQSALFFSQVSAAFLRDYILQAQAGKEVLSEKGMVGAFTLRCGVVTLTVIEELPMPKTGDADYDQRMAGLKEMHEGFSTSFKGACDLMEEIPRYSEESADAVLDAMVYASEKQGKAITSSMYKKILKLIENAKGGISSEDQEKVKKIIKNLGLGQKQRNGG